MYTNTGFLGMCSSHPITNVSLDAAELWIAHRVFALVLVRRRAAAPSGLSPAPTAVQGGEYAHDRSQSQEGAADRCA
eukprot:645576-Prorocentrum_minimum.AAC.4